MDGWFLERPPGDSDNYGTGIKCRGNGLGKNLTDEDADGRLSNAKRALGDAPAGLSDLALWTRTGGVWQPGSRAAVQAPTDTRFRRLSDIFSDFFTGLRTPR